MDFTTLTMEKQKHSHHYSDKPPYAERHVRWCERTVGELIPHLLLDYSKRGQRKHRCRRYRTFLLLDEIILETFLINKIGLLFRRLFFLVAPTFRLGDQE